MPIVEVDREVINSVEDINDLIVTLRKKVTDLGAEVYGLKSENEDLIDEIEELRS